MERGSSDRFSSKRCTHTRIITFGSHDNRGAFLNLSRETAARFSFLLSLPSVLAAALLELYKTWSVISATTENITNIIVATLVAGIVGYASIGFLLTYLKRHTTTIFIVYRLIAGTAILYLLATGKLQPL